MSIRKDLLNVVHGIFVSHKMKVRKDDTQELVEDVAGGAQRVLDQMTGGDSFGSGSPGEVWVPLTPMERTVVTQALVAARQDDNEGVNSLRREVVDKVSTAGMRRSELRG